MEKSIIHLGVGLGDDSLCGEDGCTTYLPDLLELDDYEEICPLCRDKIIEIAQHLSVMKIYEQYPELKGIQA